MLKKNTNKYFVFIFCVLLKNPTLLDHTISATTSTSSSVKRPSNTSTAGKTFTHAWLESARRTTVARTFFHKTGQPFSKLDSTVPSPESSLSISTKSVRDVFFFVFFLLTLFFFSSSFSILKTVQMKKTKTKLILFYRLRSVHLFDVRR